MKLYNTSLIKNTVLVLGIALIFVAIMVGFPTIVNSQDDDGWKKNWGVEEGFNIEIDTEGYLLPSAIVFVPNPGSGPKDPLYFVTELGGTIKVVTNDRTIYIFAENFFRIDEKNELIDNTDEFGLAAICLDPINGYIFVTYSYKGGDNKLRNNITRFETKPEIFSINPGKAIDLKNLFFPFKTDVSHQIGSCRVYENKLYVTIGDGLNQEKFPIAMESLRGKVLRFSLDLEAEPTNPYYIEDEPNATINYVWASGFRNPFALEIVNGRVFVADNGRSVDRFLQVEKGNDYLWNGEDWSIGAAADIVFSPAIGPTHIKYISPSNDVLTDKYAGTFFISATASSIRGLVNINYDLDTNSALQTPTVFLRYIGLAPNHYSGIVTGIALGADGLYFAPMTEAGKELSAVYRIFYDPANEHPYRPDDISNPKVLLSTKQCLACHSVNGRGSTLAPRLDYQILVPSVSDRINTEEYINSLNEVDNLDTLPYTDYYEARIDVRESIGMERVRLWVYYHILEPKFDNPLSQMPNVGLTTNQAEVIMNYLLSEPKRNNSEVPSESTINQESLSESGETSGLLSTNPLIRIVATVIPVVGYRHIIIFFVTGLVSGLFIMLIFSKIKDRNKNK